VERTGETQRGGRVPGNGTPMHRGHAAPASFEEAGVGRRASWVPQCEGIEGGDPHAPLLAEDACHLPVVDAEVTEFRTEQTSG
jgi:hypothetical protein